MPISPWILPLIVIAQFAGGSLWFSGNAIIGDLIEQWGISNHSISYVTSAVQLGFILGTLFFAYYTIADRYSPKRVFFLCSLLGASFNSLIIILPESLCILISLRFATGFFLAGIYPIGMKIAAALYQKGLGQALGFLVGALSIGTGFPHILKVTGYHFDWQYVLIFTSLLSVTGGLSMLLFVPENRENKRVLPFESDAFFILLRAKEIRAAAFGYFGHMWELYTLWAFTPIFLKTFTILHPQSSINISLWTFIIIASGFIGGAGGGIISQKKGSGAVAFFQLAVSGGCCLLSPLFFTLPKELFLTLMWIWGICAAGDSPQYSTLIAQKAPKQLVGSALTLVNSFGFFLTVVSIQFLDSVSVFIDKQYIFLLLAPGPAFGLYYMREFIGSKSPKPRL